MKTFAVSVALAMAALTLTPTARADIQVGNYRVQKPRDTGHVWIWAVRPCRYDQGPECLRIQAIPTPNGQAAPFIAIAQLDNGRYTMPVDVPDGVRCVVQFFPSHDVYSWDPVTMAGQVDSTFDTGCGGGPGGTDSYPFSLARF